MTALLFAQLEMIYIYILLKAISAKRIQEEKAAKAALEDAEAAYAERLAQSFRKKRSSKRGSSSSSSTDTKEIEQQDLKRYIKRVLLLLVSLFDH